MLHAVALAERLADHGANNGIPLGAQDLARLLEVGLLDGVGELLDPMRFHLRPFSL
jgi:hypothetical protein